MTRADDPDRLLLPRALRSELQAAIAIAQSLEWRDTGDALFTVFADVDQRVRVLELDDWVAHLATEGPHQPAGW